jgi:AcrR family transcriptional regulator
MNKQNTKKPAYHHGDLYNALLTEAADVIKQHGLDALSLRKLAKKCQVSSSALYRHFKDMDALVLAAIKRGYELLQQNLNSIIETCGDDTIACLKGLENSYIEFAQQHQNFFYIMYNNSLATKYAEQLNDITNEVYELVKKQIIKGIKNKIFRNDDPDVITFSMWAYLHGITMLMLQGKAKNLITTTTKSFANHLMEYLYIGITPTNQGKNHD